MRSYIGPSRWNRTRDRHPLRQRRRLALVPLVVGSDRCGDRSVHDLDPATLRAVGHPAVGEWAGALARVRTLVQPRAVVRLPGLVECQNEAYRFFFAIDTGTDGPILILLSGRPKELQCQDGHNEPQRNTYVAARQHPS
jgi:hypothetical protein